jgi:ABC-type lipoprotein export system ATPase subunit
MLEAGVPPAERTRRVAELLEYVGLAHRRRHVPGQLSGGEMQRVAVARALANRPSLLLADEPTGELDQETGREIGRLLQRVHHEGVAVVVVTHNAEIASLADRTLVLRDGRLA